MKRRAFLAAGAAGAASLAGCTGLGGGGSGGGSAVNHAGNVDASFTANGDYPTDSKPADGYPPSFEQQPSKRQIDESGFKTITTEGERITLAPIGVANYWYRRGEARFVDARGLSQYKRSHVFGAVNSPAQKNASGGGIDGWPKDDRIVAYCGCPHHLSSIRAAGLQKAGYSNVFVIDEGFWEWHRRDFAMCGTDLGYSPYSTAWKVTGEISPEYAGEYAWAVHQPSDQQEAAPIREDGSFTLHLAFSGVTDSSPVRVETPAFTVEAPLGELVAEPLRPSQPPQ